MADPSTAATPPTADEGASSWEEKGGDGGEEPRRSLTRQSTSSEPKKCWICFCDSNEDVPGETSPWRSPCPCALTAHEACLLDWIADLEAPSATRAQTRPRRDKIECPQCKAEIRIARPWSPVVAGVRAVERVGGALVVPGIASLLVGGIYSACFVHGAVSVYLVLGRQEWNRLVGPVDGGVIRAGFRLILGLPMVPIVLVLSRTKMANGLINMLPLVLFAPQFGSTAWHGRLTPMHAGSSTAVAAARETLTVHYGALKLWPPNAAVAFTVLPWLRLAYNWGYTQLFADKEREWIRAVQREPRSGETTEEVQDAEEPIGGDGRVEFQAEIVFAGADDDDDDGGERDPAVLQGEIDEAFEQAEEEELEQQQQAAAARAAADNGGGNNVRGDAAPGNAGQQQQPRVQRQNRHQHNNNNNNNNGLILSASRIADKIFGALCFPAIASLMGEFLRLGLPTGMTSRSRRVGMLNTKWGRSIVGGCLFVVMKDAFVLYSRYRLAQDHKKRRVLDYTGPRVRTSGP